MGSAEKLRSSAPSSGAQPAFGSLPPPTSLCVEKLRNELCVGAYYSFNHGTHTPHFRVKIRTHTRHISDFFFEMDKTADAYSLAIYDYLSQIHSKTKAFLIIVRHNTEGPPISDW